MPTAETLYMVVPCYNEEEVLHETAKRLKEKYQSLMARGLISDRSRVVFVNDGSKDKTWSIIKELHETDPEFFSGVNLAHNAGHQNAVLAGLMTVKELCDMAITMDADLQDDINTIDAMVENTTRAIRSFTASAAPEIPIPSSSASRRRASINS